MSDDPRDKRRRTEPFGYPVTGIPPAAPPPRDEFVPDEDTGVRTQSILARAKIATQNPPTERRHADNIAIEALVELLRASEQERRTRDMREETARRELEQAKRRRADQRKTIWLSALGIIVPTLTALAALIAALRGHDSAPSPARDHGAEVQP